MNRLSGIGESVVGMVLVDSELSRESDKEPSVRGMHSGDDFKGY